MLANTCGFSQVRLVLGDFLALARDDSDAPYFAQRISLATLAQQWRWCLPTSVLPMARPRLVWGLCPWVRRLAKINERLMLVRIGVMNPTLVMKATVPCIMAGILGIYGLIVAVILQGKIPVQTPTASWTYADGYKNLASGLACGLSGLGAGMAVGIVGDAGVRAFGQVRNSYPKREATNLLSNAYSKSVFTLACF